MRETVSAALDDNLAAMEAQFGGDPTLIRRPFCPQNPQGTSVRCCLFCIDGMVSSSLINQSILRPVMLLRSGAVGEPLMEELRMQVVQSCEAKKEGDMAVLLRAMLYGDSVLFVDGCDRALLLGTKEFLIRGISEPAGETVLKGPREGYVEPMLHNLAMLRRRLRTPQLRIEYFTLGGNTGTDCCLCYLENVVDRQALALLRRRLASVRIDGLLDSNYLAELVREHRHSLFRTTGSTERPDVTAAKLLEGRIALFADGSPVSVTVPYLFLEQFQSPEDYYVSPIYAGINRVLRLLGFFSAISILPVYLSLVTFHQAFMPLSLILSIAKARQDVPFSILGESFLLLLAFDILWEAGVRTPSNIGQTLSVVGGLVIGQAAVDARMVSVPVLIIVAVSGTCALITPKLKAAILVSRLGLTLLGVGFGLYGFLLGLIFFLLMLARQSSFGVGYLSHLPLGGTEGSQDSLTRPPLWSMKKYGRFLAWREGLRR